MEFSSIIFLILTVGDIMGEEQAVWIKELLDQEPATLSEYFYEEICYYIFQGEPINPVNLHRIRKLSARKYEDLIDCNSKEEVQTWMDDISTFIITHLSVDSLVEGYFNQG